MKYNLLERTHYLKNLYQEQKYSHSLLQNSFWVVYGNCDVIIIEYEGE